MSWIPGWGSIADSGWWSGFYFWASILALIGLGITEIASHRYSDRKDELVEQQRITEKKQHDDEIARLHLETAKTSERAAELEKENLEIRERVAGRRISQKQHDILVAELAKNPGFFHMQSMTDGESALYAADLFKAIKDGNWTTDTPEFPLGEVWHGLILFQTDDPAALRLADALKAADIPFFIGDAQHKKERATILVGAKRAPF